MTPETERRADVRRGGGGLGKARGVNRARSRLRTHTAAGERFRECRKLAGRGSFEHETDPRIRRRNTPPAPGAPKPWRRVESNHRPRDYETLALTS